MYRKVTLYSENCSLDREIEHDYHPLKSTDVFIKLLVNDDGKYAIDENGQPKFGRWFDNIGFMTYLLHPCGEEVWIGIYVKDDDKFGMMYHLEDNGDKSAWSNFHPYRHCTRFIKATSEGAKKWHDKVCGYFDTMSEMDIKMPFYNTYNHRINGRGELYQTYAGLYINWVKDESIILDDDCKLVPEYIIQWQGFSFMAREHDAQDYFDNGGWPLYVDGQKNPKTQEIIDWFMDMKNNDPEKLKDMKSNLYYGKYYGRKEWEEDQERKRKKMQKQN